MAISQDQGTAPDGEVVPRPDEPDSGGEEPAEELVVDLRDRDRTSRYVKRSGGLPHLTDDASWTPRSDELPKAAIPFVQRILSRSKRGR